MPYSHLQSLQHNTLSKHDIVPLYESEQHSIYWIGTIHDTEEIKCNSYLMIDAGEAYIFEPGGLSHFQPVFDKVSSLISPFDVTHLIISHQDPDVCASLPSWLQFNPDIRIVCPELWVRFMPHYMVYDAPYIAIPDHGSSLPLQSGGTLQCISAPFLHSPGNIVIFDSISGFLFSGDIGAATHSGNHPKLVIDDWQRHIQNMTTFHQRYMGSTRAAASFVQSVQGLPIRAMLPQHGQIFRDDEVHQFFQWFAHLPCGIDFLNPR